MKTFYSIVHAPTRQISGEQIAIGLLMTDGVKSYFHFSKEKLKTVKSLLPDHAYQFLNSYLIGLEKNINDGKNIVQDKLMTIEYINTLAVHSNNLVTFSKPSFIDIELIDSNFQNLFKKFIFEYVNKESPLSNLKESASVIVRRNLYPKIKLHVNINQVLTPKEIPALLVPSIKVNFIGRNENPVAGDVIDFESGINTVSGKILHFIGLIKAFELQKENNGKYFAIGDEPSKREFPEHYVTWQHLYKSKLIDIVPVDEIERISNYMSKHHVKPFKKN